MAYWLLKSEPSTYSWDDLVRERTTSWDGVRNFTARNNLLAMKKGDVGFFYHSGAGKDVVGLVEVTKEAYPDPTIADERFVSVEIAPRKPLARGVTLAEIKRDKKLAQMMFVRQSRLSVSPVSDEQAKALLALSAQPAATTAKPARKKPAAKKKKAAVRKKKKQKARAK